MVLPVLVWEKIFIENMQADNSLSHEDKVKMFGVDFFNCPTCYRDDRIGQVTPHWP